MSDTQEKPSLVKKEEATLQLWKENKIFEQTLNKPAPKGDYVFYDGPPFATGEPHYGHLVGSAMKDAVPRFWTMRGYRVLRQWGWDCHGLPIENIVEIELGTKSKKEIEVMGVKKFNELCRKKIFTYVDVWNKFIPRFGRWADMERPYRTMDRDYMESEWWAFKELYDKGLAYEAHRSMHICPRCETTLAQSEVAEGYKDITDLSVYVKFELLPEKDQEPEIKEPKTYLLAWTTTPWSLVGNSAIAVHPETEYAVVEAEGGRYIVAQALVGKIFGEKGRTIRNLLGRDLEGKRYAPVFPYYASDEKLKNRENGWKVYAADFVTTTDGTGLVHIAPAFGEDDLNLGKAKNLPFIQHIGMDGKFVAEVTDFAGQLAKPKEDHQAGDVAIVKYLAAHGTLFGKEKYTHSYPHCWRCDTPLLNYATSSWFVAVEKMKPELEKLAPNINWSPAHIKNGRWLNWLANARDWSISRQRFWANTIPVWRCAACAKDQVFGSATELEQASGQKITDLHRDGVDDVEVPCACGAKARRIPDVLDTWFDSGSVPFASLHYPFENTEETRKRIPADYIGEGQDQVSKWFYYQHVLSTALFGTPAYKNVIVNGIVLAEDGKKMSKRLKNYPDPNLMLEKYGADAVRLYLLSSPVVRAENLNFSEKGVEEVYKKTLQRLDNCVSFFELGEGKGVAATKESTNWLDRWMIGRLEKLTIEVTEGFERYELDAASRPFAQFVDDLSTWYVRRSRDRVKGDDREVFLGTLRHVFLELAKLLAPFTPFFSEDLYHRAGGELESVHLASWPTPLARHVWVNTFEELTTWMEHARSLVNVVLADRRGAGMNVRQPLASVTVALDSWKAGLEKFDGYLRKLVLDEVNIKELLFAKVEDMWKVTLDTVITPELKEEGMLRDLSRVIQDLRKEAGLQPGDKILLTVGAAIQDFIEKNKAALMKAVGAVDVSYGEGEQKITLDGETVAVSVKKHE